MTRSKIATTVAFVFGCASELALQVAHADVTLEERTSVKGAGVMSLANMSISTTSTYSGDRARLQSDPQAQSKLMRAFARGVGPTAEIVQLGEDKVYELDLKKKRYTESSLAARREQLQAAMRQVSQAQSQAAPPMPDPSQCEWSAPRAELKKSGEQATFAGQAAERVTIVATQSCKLKQTAETCDVALILDQWRAPEFPGGEEVLGFQRALAEKMGINAALSQDLSTRAESMFGRYEGIWKQLREKTSDLTGYPVKSSFSLSYGGSQCRSTAQAGAAPSRSAGANGEGEAMASATGEAVGRTAAYKAGEHGLGGVAGDLGGRIAGSLFRRKKQAEASPAGAETTAPVEAAGMSSIMSITSELLSVTTTPAAPGTFEVPADFKRTTQR